MILKGQAAESIPTSALDILEDTTVYGQPAKLKHNDKQFE